MIRAVCAVLFLGACASTPNRPQPTDTAGQATLLVFSDLRGTLEPCGCSPDLRRGGVARITEHVQRARIASVGAPLLHAGNLLLDDEGVPAERAKQIDRRTKAIAFALDQMGLSAATLGPHDLALGVPWLRERLAAVRAPIVVTNAKGAAWDGLVQPTHRLRHGGREIGIIGLVPPSAGEGLVDPRSAAAEAVTRLRAEGADLIVALSSLGLRQSKRLMRKRLGIDVMLAGGQGLDALVTDEVEAVGDGRLIQSFVQGGQVGRLVLGGEAPTYALTPIGWDLPEDEVVAKEMADYNHDLEEINLAAAGTLPPLAEGQAYYVGAEACFECHEDTKAFWQGDKHQIAWETLEKENKTFDLECISCHATGYGKPGGSILGAMKNLVDVQCEQCHGPGSLHAEDGDIETIRRVVPQRVCVECHNEKHSTGFDYVRYRQKLLVPGHGKPLD